MTHIKPEPVDEEEKFGPRNVTRIKPEPVDEEEKFRPRNVKRIKSEPVDKSEQCSDSEHFSFYGGGNDQATFVAR